MFCWVPVYFHDGASKEPTASHDDFGKEQSTRCASRVEVCSLSWVFCTPSVFVGVAVLHDLFSVEAQLCSTSTFFQFLQTRFLEGFSTSDPKWFIPANPLSHQDGAEGNSMDVQTPVEPGKSPQKVVRTVVDPEVQTL